MSGISIIDLSQNLHDNILSELWSYFTYKDIIKISMINKHFRENCYKCNEKHPIPISLENFNILDFNDGDFFDNILKKIPVVKKLTMRPLDEVLACKLSKAFTSKFNNPEIQKHLTYLSLMFGDDIDLIKIDKLINLTYLDLSGSEDHPGIKDNSIGYLQSLTTLTYLNISDCSRITDIGLSYLTILTNLEILKMRNLVNISDIGTNQLSTLVKLKDLNISRCYNLTDNGLQFLASLLNLENLYMCYLNIIGEGLSNLRHSNKIKVLEMTHCQSLESFDLGYLTLNNDMIDLNLYQCNKLTNLSGFSYLEKLQSLDLGFCVNIPQNQFINLSSLVNLKRLSLMHSEISNEAMQNLLSTESLNNLVHLNLNRFNSDFNDETLSYMSRHLTKLSYLGLSGCDDITDNGLKYLSNLRSSLKSLTIFCCKKITEVGIMYFSFLDRGMSLSYTQPHSLTARTRRLIHRDWQKVHFTKS